MSVVIVVQCQTKLFDVVLTGRTTGGFTSLLDGGEQQSNKNCDDRDHNKQLDEGEPSAQTGSPNHVGGFLKERIVRGQTSTTIIRKC